MTVLIEADFVTVDAGSINVKVEASRVLVTTLPGFVTVRIDADADFVVVKVDAGRVTVRIDPDCV